MIRRFHIVAIPIRIVVNRFGDHDPEGMMYVLKENENRVKRQVENNPFTPVDLVEPLVIRANVGDDIEILLKMSCHSIHPCTFKKSSTMLWIQTEHL